ncbi:MAG: anti-sigma factor family protein [Rhodoferax sp.]
MTTHISLALDKELGASETAELNAHLEQCTPCRGRLARMEASDAMLRDLASRLAAAVAVHADDLPQRVMARLRGSAAPEAGMHGFMRLVIHDKSLQEQISRAAASHTPQALAAALVDLGNQHGYAFAREQVLSLLARRPASNDELSEDELRTVVAGASDTEAQFIAVMKRLPGV